MSMCKATFSVDPVSHRELKSLVNDNKEHGGNLVLDYASKSIRVPGDIQRSKKLDQVRISRSLIDFHTHPSRCVRDVCAISTPSPADLLNVAAGALYGNVTHFLYTPDGTYRINVKPATLRELKDATKRQRFIKDVNEVLYELYKLFDDGKMTYAAYNRRFLSLARKLGFSIRLFKKSQIPTITVSYECGKASNRASEVSFLEIPDDVVRSFRPTHA